MLALPYERWTLGDALAERARLTPDATFVRMVGGSAVSFARMQADAVQLACALQQAGVAAGDRVVVMGANSLTTLRAWFALNLLGACDVTINTAYRGRTLAHAINTAGATLMLVEDRLLPVLAESEAEVPTLRRALCYAAEGEGPYGATSDAAPMAVPAFGRIAVAPLASIAADPGGWTPPGARPEDLASIIFTSGTSGPAKGVMLPQAQTYLLGLESAEGLRVTTADIYYVFHPLFHMSPRYVGLYAALIAGAQVCLDRTFSASDWLARIRDAGATVTIGHGPMLEMIHAEPERPDDADNPLQRLATSPFPRHIAQDFERRFGLRGLEVWGMTEVNIPLWNSLDEPWRPGCGKLIGDHYEVRIVDPQTDRELPDGEVGELVVRSRLPFTLMQGYFGMPEKTVEAWRNFWFHTGDTAYREPDGQFHFVDRLGDRIRRRAENISSYEIECAAAAHAAVRECAAVGVPSEFAGDDDIKLVIACREGRTVEPAELLAFLLARLPHYMVPRYVERVAALPRTPTNKVQKALLRQAGVTPSTWDRKAAGVVLKALAAAR